MNFVYCLIDGDNVTGLRRDHKDAEDSYLAEVNDQIFFGGTLLNSDRTEARGSLLSLIHI